MLYFGLKSVSLHRKTKNSKIMSSTAVYPKMSQAQAMVGLYRSMSKKAKDEFRRWFFENEGSAMVAEEVTSELMASIEEGRQQIRNGQCKRCRTKEDLDNLFASL